MEKNKVKIEELKTQKIEIEKSFEKEQQTAQELEKDIVLIERLLSLKEMYRQKLQNIQDLANRYQQLDNELNALENSEKDKENK